MREEKVYFENQGEKIEGILTKPEKETKSLIILVHGFTGSRDGPDNIFINLTRELVSKNFSVLRFNFRFTTQNFNNFYKMTIRGEVDDLGLIIDEMSKKYGKIGLMGESLGGTVALLSPNEKIECLVLWYPAVFVRETELGSVFLSEDAARELEKTGFVKGRKSDGKEYRAGREFVEELKTLEVIPYVGKIDYPTLIIHGERDRAVPFIQSENLLGFLKEPKRLEKIKEVCHGWKNKDLTTDYNFEAQQKTIKLTVEWFNKWLR